MLKQSPMRKLVKEYVKIVAETLPILEPIYEFGALQVSGQETFADLRPFFPNKRYIGCDIRKGPGVDKIINLHHTGLPSESVGTVLILDTLEHVEFCREAIEEVHRILRPEGIFVLSSVMDYPIHDTHDYWRFTPEGFSSLLVPFSYSFIDYVGKTNFPHTVVGLASKSSAFVNGDFSSYIRTLKRKWNNPLTQLRKCHSKQTWKDIVKLFIPTIILIFYQGFRAWGNSEGN